MMASNWIDIIKLGWGTPLVCPENFIKKKINVYKENKIEICTGGTFLEISYKQEKVDAFLKKMKELGFTAIEVSNGKLDIDKKNKANLIQNAKDFDFRVFSEIGKKDPIRDRELSLSERILEAKSDLRAGAEKVILEARSSGRLGIYDQSCNVRENFAKTLVKGIGLKNIIFEAPKKNQQVWLILNFGSNINIGNIKPESVISLETLRRGIRGDTFGKLC
jgi:phosphosulfolactate synthase